MNEHTARHTFGGINLKTKPKAGIEPRTLVCRTNALTTKLPRPVNKRNSTDYMPNSSGTYVAGNTDAYAAAITLQNATDPTLINSVTCISVRRPYTSVI